MNMLNRATLLAGLCLFGFAASHGAEYQAVKRDGAVAIDGKLSEKTWQKALKFDKFYINNTTQPGFPAQAYLLYDDDAVYVAFHCPLPPGGKLKSVETRRDGRVYMDDCVEVMIDPNKTGDRYFHFQINPDSVIFDRYCDQGGYVGDAKWNGNIRAKAFKGDGFWSAELRIPYSTLDIDPKGSRVWGFNFCRDTREPNQEASVAPNGVFNVAGSFLPIAGINMDPARYGWETSPVTADCAGAGDELTVTLKAPVSNLDKAGKNAKVDFTLLGQEIIADTVAQQFKAGETITVTTKPLAFKHPGKYDCVLSITDPVTRKVLKRRTYPLTISFAPLKITLAEPHYRNAIFATQQLDHVVYTVTSNIPAAKKITTGIRDLNGKILACKTLNAPGKVQFPVSPLPEIKMEIFAKVDGEKEVVHPLRKLPYRKGEVWLDKDRYWRVDGKRYLLIGEWNDVSIPGIDVSNIPRKGVKDFDFTLAFSSFPAKYSYKLAQIPPKAEKIIRETTRKRGQNPALFAYYLSDEPEIAGISASGLIQVADFMRDEDPYHPIVISNNSVTGGKDFAPAAEINGLHPYPSPAKNTPKSNFTRVVLFMDQAIDFNKNRKNPQTIAYLQQGFNYGDHGAQNSRIPTYDEIRTQYLMSLIMGGRGIITYNRTTPHYPELHIGMPAFVKELRALENQLVANDVIDPANKCDNPNIRWMLKKYDHEYWLFAVSTTHKKEKAHFTIPALGGKKLNLVSEKRSIEVKNGVFSDTFDNFEVHIYTTGAAPALESIGSIEKRIAAANAKRRKPGNLAYQEFEHDHIKISASSNKVMRGRADSNLWHVTDGVIVDYDNPSVPLVVWSDATADKAPDWIELEFKKPITIGRAVLHAREKTLRAYELQIWDGKNWQAVAGNNKNRENRCEHRFAAVTTSKVRLFVTATNGPHVKLDEIELYAD